MLWTPPSWNHPPTLILASQSPRRKALLEQLGIKLATLSTDTCEQAHPKETASALVQRLADDKATAGTLRLVEAVQSADLPSALFKKWCSLSVLGADTLVVDDGEVLTKPENRTQGEAYLRRLSGRTHKVITGVSVTEFSETTNVCDIVWRYLGETDVTFRSLREEWIQRYWDTGEPQDKAGGYGIQGFGALFVASIRGSYNNVVGLPVEAVGNWLASRGEPLWQTSLNSVNPNREQQKGHCEKRE